MMLSGVVRTDQVIAPLLALEMYVTKLPRVQLYMLGKILGDKLSGRI